MKAVATRIKNRLFTNWHTMRWVALAISVFFAAMGVLYQDVLTGFFSAFFLFQALTNTGCMVSQSCGVPASRKTQESTHSEVEFSEIKES
ncbi:hypothetical protein [Gracilimonas mengyeensis]|uniref:DUF2892 domain-containing protein n=1 Tax=Gracilimonas mengyeensis TaxID=1302730 RepID=A0A521C5I4_9BACT|nr:hypothetical protein [Gracilimonas mengyeensis]SMO54682.1 hypothetical protein SAMN06265219_104186 [Gracilimonas mengyeensis]